MMRLAQFIAGVLAQRQGFIRYGKKNAAPQANEH